MKFHFRWASAALFAVALGASSVAEAAFVDRGGGLIYDADANIPSNVYRSDMKYALDPGPYAQNDNLYGSLDAYDGGNGNYASVVRPGDAAPIPHPTACWLFGSGLIGLFGIARRKAA